MDFLGKRFGTRTVFICYQEMGKTSRKGFRKSSLLSRWLWEQPSAPLQIRNHTQFCADLGCRSHHLLRFADTLIAHREPHTFAYLSRDALCSAKPEGGEYHDFTPNFN